MRLRIFFSAASILIAGQFVAATASGQGSQCNRSCLEGFVDRYLDAVVAHDPSTLAFAADLRFSENGQRLEIGDGLWRSMQSKGNYRLFVSDTTAGQVAFIGTINEQHRDPNAATPALIALRLKIEADTISEVEQFIVRSVEAAQRVEAMASPHPVYLETVPENERMTRVDLITTANKYFTGMQQNDGKGDYPFTDDCNRIENGRQSTNVPTPQGETRPDPATATGYSGQWSCREQFESGLLYFVTRIRDRRFVAVDQERGLVFSFVFFDHSAGDTRNFTLPSGRAVTAGPVQPWTWQIAELFKVENGQLRQIEAILERSPYGMLSGWSSWEDGMSDRALDATM